MAPIQFKGPLTFRAVASHQAFLLSFFKTCPGHYNQSRCRCLGVPLNFGPLEKVRTGSVVCCEKAGMAVGRRDAETNHDNFLKLKSTEGVAPSEQRVRTPIVYEGKIPRIRD